MKATIVTLDASGDAIDCGTLDLPATTADIDEFVRLTLDEDDAQELQLLDAELNPVERRPVGEKPTEDEDAVRLRIRKWSRAAREAAR